MKPDLKKMVELARSHVEADQIGAAEVYYRSIIGDTSPPGTGIERMAHSEGCVFFARRALAEGRYGTAGDWYIRAVLADPLAVEHRVEYIIRTLMPMGLIKTGLIEAKRATKIDPANPDAWRILGAMEEASCNANGAIVAYERQLELAPTNPNAMVDRAAIAINVGDYVTATEMAHKVIGTDRHGDALLVKAMVAYREARHEDAIELYDEAIANGCNDPAMVEWNKSLALHAIGRYAEGWPAHESRGKQKTDGPMALIMNRFKAPMLKFEDALCRVHVHQEMGHGDTIAMLRYLEFLTDLGHQVSLEINDEMVSLAQRSFPRVKVVPKAVDYPGALGIPMFDKHLPILSFPAIFETDIDSVPWSGPYLTPDSALEAKYRRALQHTHPAFQKIGLCWSSGIRSESLWLAQYGKNKSMPFVTMWEAFADTPVGSVLVSLQVGPESADATSRVWDLLPAKPTWDDTAALVATLDLVVTVDTAVAHLAGAMGKPTWLLMQKDGASWHFMCERPGAAWNERSPWYPSVRIFRQDSPGDWGSVIGKVARELRQMTAVPA